MCSTEDLQIFFGATDGHIGHVKDFYSDDDAWAPLTGRGHGVLAVRSKGPDPRQYPSVRPNAVRSDDQVAGQEESEHRHRQAGVAAVRDLT